MARAVETSPDFERICNLPVRHVDEQTQARANAFMTPLLTTPKGKAAGAHLIGWQGTVLEELSELDGGYSQMGVGEGKSLITYVAPYVVEAERPILIVPAKLREKTWIEFQRYAQHWITPRPPARVMAYHDFYDRDDVDLFETLRPDFVMLDEVQHARNQEGSFTKRLDRWVVKSNCKVWCGTGTGTRFSIKDFSHMIIWGLNDGAPMPLDSGELDTWASAIDEKQKWTGGAPPKRVRVGVLTQLDRKCRKARPDFYMTEQGEARFALRARLHATPGVIISLDDSCKQPLTIDLVPAPEDAALNEHFVRFREESAMPNLDVIADAPVMYTKEKQLGAGFFIGWDPPPPEAWRDARREYAKFVNEAIKRTAHLGYRTRPAGHEAGCKCKTCKGITPLDTPGAVLDRYADHPVVRAWLDIKPTYDEQTRADWVSASVVHYAAKYAREVGGLIWCEFTELGEAVAKACGVPYYGEDGRSAQGQSIENEPGGRSVVLSFDANFEGRNLQGGPLLANKDGWHDNLFIGVKQSAERLEQAIGRTHRRGQLHPVKVTLLMTSGLSLESWETAQREAGFVQQSQGQEQKILRAKVTVHPWPSDAVRWRVRAPEKKESKMAKPSKGFGEGRRV